MAVLRPLRVVIDNYPEGQVEEFDLPVSSPGSGDGITERSLQPGAVRGTRGFHGESPQKVLQAGSGQRSAPPVRVLHKMCERRERSRRQAMWSKCIVPTIRKHEADLLLMGGRSMQPSTGYRRLTPSQLKCASMTVLFRVANPLEAGSDFTEHLNPNSLEILTSAEWNRVWQWRCLEVDSSSKGSAISVSILLILPLKRRYSTEPQRFEIRGPKSRRRGKNR